MPTSRTLTFSAEMSPAVTARTAGLVASGAGVAPLDRAARFDGLGEQQHPSI
jgi:hypothetical protein